ncbi:MAG TPA: twin-arginine translocase TatA/TatE family subunit [Acidimicrobiales bacterium]|jgi:Tat protein translocase TatB subunit|nr:twin-arginine translocase TatA/TatE family subunit [Acidimicrobiales bacterium]
MPSSLGPAEILVILLVALIVLGPNKLPGAARQVGKTLAEVRKWSQSVQDDIRTVIDTDEAPSYPTEMLRQPEPTSGAAAPAAAPVWPGQSEPPPPAPPPPVLPPPPLRAPPMHLPMMPTQTAAASTDESAATDRDVPNGRVPDGRVPDPAVPDPAVPDRPVPDRPVAGPVPPVPPAEPELSRMSGMPGEPGPPAAEPPRP